MYNDKVSYQQLMEINRLISKIMNGVDSLEKFLEPGDTPLRKTALTPEEISIFLSMLDSRSRVRAAKLASNGMKQGGSSHGYPMIGMGLSILGVCIIIAASII